MSTALRRAHQPNHAPKIQTPRAVATAIAAATAQGNTSLCMGRSDFQKTCWAKLIAAQASTAIHASVINTTSMISKR
jgi:DNA transposition AAA+ family ATPase